MSYVPIPLVPYRFEYDKSFFNPSQRAAFSMKGEVFARLSFFFD